MSEPVFTVPLEALFDFDQRWWGCRWCHENEREKSPEAARAAAVTHLESVHGIHVAEEPAEETDVDWIAIANQCRRFVSAHDDPHVDDQILGSILRNLRDIAGSAPEMTVTMHTWAMETRDSPRWAGWYEWRWICGCGSRGRWQNQSPSAASYAWAKHAGVEPFEADDYGRRVT